MPTPAQERQVLDVYSPPRAKDLPVVFWIHGGGWQTGDKSRRPDQAAGVHGQGVRLRLHQLPAPAARRDGDHRARHRQVDPLGARPHRRVRGRPAAAPRHGPFRRRAARRAGLHRRSLPEGRGAVAGDHQRLRARRWRHLRRAGHHRDGGDPSPRSRPAASDVSATARSSATTRRSTATSPP